MIKRILVCVKLVPTAASVEMDGQFRLKRDGTNLQLNIADVSALEAALRLKAATPDAEVVVLSMGPAKTSQTLQELYALGADRVVLLSDPALAGADSFATAKALVAAIRCLGDFDCLLCGRRAIDAETGQIPGQLAAALGIPAVTNVQQLTARDNGILCQRRLENGTVQLEIAAPCLLSVCEYTYQLRLPGIMGKRRARDKQVEMLTAVDVGLSAEECGLRGSKTKVIRVDTKAPGLRKCSYCQTNVLAEIIREVQL